MAVNVEKLTNIEKRTGVEKRIDAGAKIIVNKNDVNPL